MVVDVARLYDPRFHNFTAAMTALPMFIANSPIAAARYMLATIAHPPKRNDEVYQGWLCNAIHDVWRDNHIPTTWLYSSMVHILRRKDP